MVERVAWVAVVGGVDLGGGQVVVKGSFVTLEPCQH